MMVTVIADCIIRVDFTHTNSCCQAKKLGGKCGVPHDANVECLFTQEQLNQNYQTIRIQPETFPNLLIRDIGFERVEHLAPQKLNKSEGR